MSYNLAINELQVLNQKEARYNSADLNIAYRMNVDEYQKLCPYAEALEENWGKPPGEFSCSFSFESAQIFSSKYKIFDWRATIMWDHVRDFIALFNLWEGKGSRSLFLSHLPAYSQMVNVH